MNIENKLYRTMIKKSLLFFGFSAALLVSACENNNSVFDPDFKLPGTTPVIDLITPDPSYLAGVDSVIVTGQNFSSNIEELTINFGGAPGVILKATETELLVRPGVKHGVNMDVKVSKRGAEFFSDSYTYTLRQPMGFYPGTDINSSPNTPVAVDGNNNIYALVNRNGIIRYTKIAPDGTITRDLTRFPGEPRPDPEDKSPFPTDSTMRFTSYSDLEIGPNGDMFMTEAGIRAIFTKPFGNDKREGVWAASSSGALKIQDIVFDSNGYLWVVGLGSNEIHRFTVATKSENKFPFTGDFKSVAFSDVNNELFVAGDINGSNQIWKFAIDGSGNLDAGTLYFDFGSNYDGIVNSMIVASNGELIIATTAEESLVRLFPNGKHEKLYPGMTKQGAFSLTWLDNEFAVVAITGDEKSINFLDMFDRRRAGIFGF